MMSFLEQEIEDLLAMARIAHHQAWCAVNQDWINEPQQLESMLFVATNVLDRPRRVFYDCDFRALRQADVCSDRFAG